MDEMLRLSCPTCRAIDWSRDGVTMAVDINGEIHRVGEKSAYPVETDASWECQRCGFRAVAGSDLAVHLANMKVALSFTDH